jgi:hypothetical protein
MRDWAFGVERVIREAQERGDFDRIPLGQPLPDERWDGEWGMAHHVLKQAGGTLPWIALGQDVDAQRARLKAVLERATADYAWWASRADGEDLRQRTRQRYLETAAALDRLMGDFNLLVPIRRLDKGRFPRHMAERTFDAACPPIR